MSALEEVTRFAAPAIGVAALLAGAVVLVRTRRPAAALPVLLELLLAAGLLRLVGDPGWHTIATAAAIVVLRRLIGDGLQAGGGSWSSPGGTGSARPPAQAGGGSRGQGSFARRDQRSSSCFRPSP